MGKEINVILADERLELRKMERSELKGVYTDAVLSFNFYATSYKGCEFLLRNDSRNVDCYRITFFPKNQDRGIHGRLLRCIRVDY